MADIAMPTLTSVVADSFQPMLIRIAAPKMSAAPTSDSTAIAPVELKAEMGVFAHLESKEIYKSDKGGKLVQFNVDVLLINGNQLTYQLFKHSVMKNMDSSKPSMSAAGPAVGEATRSCHLVASGSVSKDGAKVKLEGDKEMTFELVQDGHLKISGEPGIFCRLGRQYSMELQNCDKLSWIEKDGAAKGTTVCALAECAGLI
eukprot:CAMPEP_0204593166 /NCGR_PEP_ID=MMETSP0661-20131031/51350_1 /ASSEMBLY_ACC=CAM_ASM_000606 /TAXON_ID=109239 /ORGANISM="Alexandrium margalefi, Strain AMGDE01CS-322" /LENGTH=201 /DNA_ID=CAMNT_0051603453 /DNA_START=90 /DNA_END=695 /DNA_ORIENTATION=+